MGMAEYKLVSKFVADVGNVKRAFLLTNLSIETDMEKHISKFLANIQRIVFHEGIA